MQTAEQRGVWAFGQASDMHEFGPNAQASAIVNNWDDYYLERAKAVENGSWKQNDIWGGFNDNMVRMGQYGDKVPANVVKLAEGHRLDDQERPGPSLPGSDQGPERDGPDPVPATRLTTACCSAWTGTSKA